MKKHLYSIDQKADECLYPLPQEVNPFLEKVDAELVNVEYYAQQWFRTRLFRKEDMDLVHKIFAEMSQALGVDDVKEFLKEKYLIWTKKWSVNCYPNGKFCTDCYYVDRRLRYYALPWVINFELTNLLESIEAEQQHKNLAMSILRSEVAYVVKAVPGD